MQKRITINENFNGKLLCAFFSVVELHEPEKHKPGNVLECFLNDKKMGDVEVMQVRSFSMRDLRPVLSFIDIGQPPHKKTALLRKQWDNKIPIGPDTKLDHIVLRYVTRDLKNQADELFDYWNGIEKICNQTS